MDYLADWFWANEGSLITGTVITGVMVVYWRVVLAGMAWGELYVRLTTK